jgi:peptidoglycan/xylan/chitin deacetylase (PgdA/CDA1 family)
MTLKHQAYAAGLAALGRSGIAGALRPLTQGSGAVLMFHRVRPHAPQSFDPHRGLEIEPAFLDAVLVRLRQRGFAIVPLDEVPERLASPGRQRFAVLTFDDGYRDNLEEALPILRRHGAPFTLFVTTGFADGEAPLWWLDLADAMAREPSPSAAFAAAYSDLRRSPDLRARIAALASARGIDGAARTRALCLGWDELRALAAEPLCTIGAHTLTHPILGALPEAETRDEVIRAKKIIEERLQRAVRHFAYPVGDAAAAGRREFAMAREAGYATAVTTRPGMLFPEHASHLHALPRLSVNGHHQSLAAFDALLSGAPFFLLNRGRRLNVT